MELDAVIEDILSFFTEAMDPVRSVALTEP